MHPPASGHGSGFIPNVLDDDNETESDCDYREDEGEEEDEGGNADVGEEVNEDALDEAPSSPTLVSCAAPPLPPRGGLHTSPDVRPPPPSAALAPGPPPPPGTSPPPQIAEQAGHDGCLVPSQESAVDASTPTVSSTLTVVDGPAPKSAYAAVTEAGLPTNHGTTGYPPMAAGSKRRRCESGEARAEGTVANGENNCGVGGNSDGPKGMAEKEMAKAPEPVDPPSAQRPSAVVATGNAPSGPSADGLVAAEARVTDAHQDAPVAGGLDGPPRVSAGPTSAGETRAQPAVCAANEQESLLAPDWRAIFRMRSV